MNDIENVEDYTNAIGKRILARRKQLGFTQEFVADKANLSHQFFSAVETGKKNMKAESIIKLSIALEVSCDYILMGKRNTNDFSYLSNLIDSLNHKQIKHLEEIIKNFVEVCKYND